MRFKNPKTTISFVDLVRGEVRFDTTDLGDFVIAKNIDEPLYHLAVVIDDHEMDVTHVIRGEDHISNTPRQILILEALQFVRPEYAHIPLILAPDRSKLSKRHGAVSINEYRKMGFLPQAVVNYLALLGWNPGGEKELFSLEELVKMFEIGNINQDGSIFDLEKLRWFNRQYLLAREDASFAKEAEAILRESISAKNLPWNDSVGKRLTVLLRERVSVWEDIRALVREGEFDYFFTAPRLEAATIPGKGSDANAAIAHLEYIRGVLAPLSPKEFESVERIKSAVWEYATKEGRGAVLWPLRYSLTGKERSPDPFAICVTIGKDAVLERIDNARATLKNAS